MRPIQVDCRSPGSLILVRKIWPEIREIVALGSQVVIDHVEHYGNALQMTGVDQSLEGSWSAVGILHGIRENPTKEFMSKIAEFFDIKPSFFYEYRMIQLMERLEKTPELIDVFLDISSNPGELISAYKNCNPYHEKLSSYAREKATEGVLDT